MSIVTILQQERFELYPLRDPNGCSQYGGEDLRGTVGPTCTKFSLVPRPRFPQLRMDYITATWKVSTHVIARQKQKEIIKTMNDESLEALRVELFPRKGFYQETQEVRGRGS